MEDTDFSDDFCRFIQTTLPTVQAAELLLWLCEHAHEWCEPGEVLYKLPAGSAIERAEATRYLELFETQGLLALGPDKRIRFRPASEGDAQHVRTLVQAYRERPVTLIRMIYALRDAKVQSFADAFKLRRK